MSKFLNLGCGYVTPDNWVNADINPIDDNVIQADIIKGLPFEDNYFDFVLMNHVLQVFNYNQLADVLSEVKRVMKKGGKLRILTPDLQVAVEAFIEGNTHIYPISDKLESTPSGKFARYLFWHGDTHCAFDEYSLADLLSRNGFYGVEKSYFGKCELDSRQDESLIMECIK